MYEFNRLASSEDKISELEHTSEENKQRQKMENTGKVKKAMQRKCKGLTYINILRNNGQRKRASRAKNKPPQNSIISLLDILKRNASTCLLKDMHKDVRKCIIHSEQPKCRNNPSIP